jgi:alkylation response protein AidB-like acyl-CoA dehydrogenase
MTMDLDLGEDINRTRSDFERFLQTALRPHLTDWQRQGTIPRSFFADMGSQGWLGYSWNGVHLTKHPGIRETVLLETLARMSPGIATAVLIVSDLGLTALSLFGTDEQKQRYGRAAAMGDRLLCLGNSENRAGSDAGGIEMTAEKIDGGWLLNGAKAYTTNGWISDLAVVTAVTDPDAPRSRRLSMFLVDLAQEGVHRRRLNKQVWIPSDLTRIELHNVAVPKQNLMGVRGRGLSQVLTVFTFSRIPIAGIALGTAQGAFDLALQRARTRTVFGRPIAAFQSKSFEVADFYARLEAARRMVYRAAAAMDSGKDFRMEASLAKYLAVQIARELTPWAADLFGAASVIGDHPIHKFPMDAWAVSLAEGTQDIQKLIIFRELIKQRDGKTTSH